MLNSNFQSVVSQTNNSCSFLSHILAKLLLLDISCENSFALSIVTALFARPFSIKKRAGMSVFYVKTLKIRWQLGAYPQTPLASEGWGIRPQTLDCSPPCPILSAPLESDCHTSEHLVFAQCIVRKTLLQHIIQLNALKIAFFREKM